ncbi:hypothetical protein D3C87_1168020 [compost metagenome]
MIVAGVACLVLPLPGTYQHFALKGIFGADAGSYRCGEGAIPDLDAQIARRVK